MDLVFHKAVWEDEEGLGGVAGTDCYVVNLGYVIGVAGFSAMGRRTGCACALACDDHIAGGLVVSVFG